VRLALALYGHLEMVSGGFLYDRRLVGHLRSRGESVTVLSLPWRSYPLGLLDNLSPALRRRLAALDADVLLQDELAHPSLFWLNRRLRSRRPLVAIIHHLRCREEPPGSWRHRLFAAVERRYLASVDAYIVNSRATLDTVAALAGGLKPAVVAPPGANRFQGLPSPEEIAARARGPGPCELIFLGNVIPRKGLHLLVRALAGLTRRDWRLTVVGSLEVAPAYVRKVREQAAVTGMLSRVEFTGTLGNAALAARLARSHLLAVPSWYEGFGICYLEGMAFGLPAIGSAAGGAGEIITHGRDGFLVAPGDVAALTGHLERLLADRDLLLNMSLAARARFLAHPPWEASLTAVHRFLLNLTAPP
jgi:glycosyltransferase involved in cell wall biosynthesis